MALVRVDGWRRRGTNDSLKIRGCRLIGKAQLCEQHASTNERTVLGAQHV